MSSIILKKDHDGKNAGTVISVPFLVGKMLIANGVGMYPADKPKAGLVEIPVTASSKAEPMKAEPPAKAEPATKPRDIKAIVEDEPPMKPEFPPTPTPKPESSSHEKFIKHK